MRETLRTLCLLSELIFCMSCVNTKTWSGDVYDCPRELLERVDKVLIRCESSLPQSEQSIKEINK